MRLIWSEEAWDDYLYWQDKDKKILKHINFLIKEVLRHPSRGIGEPEPLKHNMNGYWSRHITREHRLIYRGKNDDLLIAQCRYHY